MWRDNSRCNQFAISVRGSRGKIGGSLSSGDSLTQSNYRRPKGAKLPVIHGRSAKCCASKLLTIAISLMNSYNRMAISFRKTPQAALEN